jgi:glutathione S-transferase
VFHVAERAEWEATVAGRPYPWSTRGLELDAVGFVHLAEAGQVRGVLERYYVGVDDLVLLSVDIADGDDLRDEAAEGADERFPHLYRALTADDVVAVTDLADDDAVAAALARAEGERPARNDR